MGLVDDKMKDYKLSRLIVRSDIRHITLESSFTYAKEIKSLCKFSTHFYRSFNLHTASNTYPDLYKDLCKKCFKKLPVEIQTELKFKYMVYKLKNED